MGNIVVTELPHAMILNELRVIKIFCGYLLHVICVQANLRCVF